MATAALAPTKTSAPANEPVACRIKPITIGVVMPAVLPKVLNKPPLRPPASLGEVSDTTAQPSAPMPLPKKATAMIATTSQSADT